MAKKSNKKEFCVFGLGKFGKSIALTLANYGHNVLAIDKSEEVVGDISEFVTHAVAADVTDIDVLMSLGIGNFDIAVVAISQDMQSSIMATMLLKELGVRYVLAKAQNEIHKKVLLKIGADRVVFPEREMGNRIATSLISENIMDFIELSSEYSIIEIVALDEWINKTLLDINMRANYGINVMAIRRGEDINITPGANEAIEEGDILVVIGAQADLQKISTQAGR